MQFSQQIEVCVWIHVDVNICVWEWGRGTESVREQSVFEALCCCNIGGIQVGKDLIITISLWDCSDAAKTGDWGELALLHANTMLLHIAIMITHETNVIINEDLIE